MKRGIIITFFNEINYGAVLQAYALQTKLGEMLDEVYILDYQPKALFRRKQLVNTSGYKAFLLSLIMLPVNLLRKRAFKFFIVNRLNTISLHDIDNGGASETFLFLGSDQIWNPMITGGVDPHFFGTIPDLKRNKTIAYAPSIGVAELRKDLLCEMSRFLEHIDCLSVREESAKRIIQTQTSKPVEIVADPTALIVRDGWDDLMRCGSEKNDYIFIYSLSQNTRIYEIAEKLSQEYSLPIREVYLGNRPMRCLRNHHRYIAATPQKFIQLISSARYIVTDSFHGTAFSVYYHKDFYSLPLPGKESRVLEFLSRLNLSDRVIQNKDQCELCKTINYDEVEALLTKQRQSSIRFLERSIQNEK